MMCDDLGYADLGCYGSEIPTPNIDRIASEGLRYTDYHSTPMCSPTRAALLTGLEPHRAGVGHVAHSDPGFPGYAMELTPFAPTLPELLRDSGYQTLMVGKWHLTKDSQVNDAGDRSSWPLQKGFDRYYGFLDAFTNFHHPHRLIEDNHAVAVDRYPDDYFVTDDFTDRAISMVRESKASNPSKPFFLYFAHAAVHAPLQAKAVDIETHAGRYREGWDVIRQRRYERQVELGVVPADVGLAPRNTEPGDEVAAWDDLSVEEQTLFARYMEVYAALVDNIDQNVGRFRAALEELGEWDNTLFIFTSDNGGSREGEERGTERVLPLAPLRSEGHAGAVRGGPGAAGSHRRADHVARTTPAAGRWPATRRSGSTRSTPIGVAIRFRSWCRGRPARCCPRTVGAQRRAASSGASSST